MEGTETTYTCPECGEELSEEDTRCPHCGCEFDDDEDDENTNEDDDDEVANDDEDDETDAAEEILVLQSILIRWLTRSVQSPNMSMQRLRQ